MRPLPTNVEFLVYLANDSGQAYQAVYLLWCDFYDRADAYLIVETILHIGKTYRLPILAAKAVFDQGPTGVYASSRPLN